MIRVLLVDDHPVVRAGYKRLLETDAAIEVAAEASDADSAYLSDADATTMAELILLLKPGK